MSFPIPIIGDVIQTVGSIASDLITSDQKVYALETERLEGQVEINKIEAAHPSLLVSGWRPGIGWVGVAGLGYQFILYPFFIWGWYMMQAFGWIPAELKPPPELSIEALVALITGLLGLGVYRTAEKMKGKA